MQMKYGCFKMISFQQTNSRTQVTKTMNKWLSGEGIAIESFSISTDDWEDSIVDIFRGTGTVG